MDAATIEERVSISLAVGRYLQMHDRFQTASSEYSGACKNLRERLGASQRYIVQVDHKHYLVTSDKDGNFEVDRVEAI